jgi:hypothetical protein
MFLRTKIREDLAHLQSPKKSGRRSAAIGVKLLTDDDLTWSMFTILHGTDDLVCEWGVHDR